ncbi:hypothetical protein GPALN_004216 [Globodera pallida]|nr:hypothetical protein GPALN_004216 [Globodera pallida]
MILFNKCDLDQPKNKEAMALDGGSREQLSSLTSLSTTLDQQRRHQQQQQQQQGQNGMLVHLILIIVIRSDFIVLSDT